MLRVGLPLDVAILSVACILSSGFFGELVKPRAPLEVMPNGEGCSEEFWLGSRRASVGFSESWGLEFRALGCLGFGHQDV